MKRLIQTLSSVARPDLKAALEAAAIPLLSRLRDYLYGGRPLLDHVQALLDALLSEPPPPLEDRGPTGTPWWSPTPAVYLAALCEHVALPEVAKPGPGIPPHAQQSASTARELLRAGGCPFTVREHAVALIRNQSKPASLLGSGALAETYMQFACALDLRGLYWLRRAEARIAGRQRAAAALEGFREQLEGLGCFGAVPAAPLAEREVAALGFDQAAELHRALNALRYFRLVARMGEREWCAERLRQEKGNVAGRLHLLVGPAGCGKSSWAREHLAETVIVSSDRMREELTGDPGDQSQNYLVFQRCVDRVREELHRGRDVTFDATNCTERLREMPVQAGRWSGAEIVSHFFDVGLEAALERNRTRDRLVPEQVVRRHYEILDPPAIYEADRHYVVDEAGEERPYWPQLPEPAEGAQSELPGLL